MFDVNWSELLILGIVALVCIGPKDLPRFMAMIGKYAGAAKRQATEFRRHFDDAMRQAELDQVKRDIDAMAKDVNDKVMSASRSMEADVSGAKAAISAPVVAASPALPAVIAPSQNPGPASGSNSVS
jgi:sec-independent protein translocase protein TatB